MDAPATELRRGTAHDAPTVAALATQVFLDTYATAGVRRDLAHEAFSHYSTEAFAGRLAEPGRVFVLAEEAGHLVAFAELLLADRVAPGGCVRGAELVRLYVQPKAQGRGVGRVLLDRAEQLAAGARSPALWLTAWEGNPRALRFYARAGYAGKSEASYAFGGQTYANRVLAKPLAMPGDASPQPG